MTSKTLELGVFVCADRSTDRLEVKSDHMGLWFITEYDSKLQARVCVKPEDLHALLRAIHKAVDHHG